MEVPLYLFSALILLTNHGHTFILITEHHLPSPMEVTSPRKRSREVERAKGVKRRKDEEQCQSTRGKAVVTFVVAAGVFMNLCGAVIKCEVNHFISLPPSPPTHTHYYGFRYSSSNHQANSVHRPGRLLC